MAETSQNLCAAKQERQITRAYSFCCQRQFSLYNVTELHMGNEFDS